MLNYFFFILFHSAQLRGGQSVAEPLTLAVKVRHPNVERQIRRDLRILHAVWFVLSLSLSLS